MTNTTDAILLEREALAAYTALVDSRPDNPNRTWESLADAWSEYLNARARLEQCRSLDAQTFYG